MKSFKEIESTASHVKNQYALTLAIAKRVKHLKNGAPTLSDVNAGNKPIEAAFEEFALGLIEYSINGSPLGIKEDIVEDADENANK